MNRRIVTAVAGALLAAGCATVESTAPAPVSGADIALPLDEYLLTDEQIQLIGRAQRVLGRRCLARLGLSWPDTPPAVPGAAGPRHARRYYLLDLTAARTRGYQPDQPPRPPGRAEPSREALAAWTRPGGCATQASRSFTGDTATVDPQILQLETFTRTRKDPRVRQADARWSACMREAGHAYPDPVAADGDARWRSPVVAAGEITVATADVLCKQRTGHAEVMLAVETAYQQEVVDAHRAALLDVRAGHQRRIATAIRILASQPPPG